MLAALVCSLLSTTASALEIGADVAVYAEKETLLVGEQLKVAVYIENIKTDDGIVACDIPLSYDKSVLKIVAVEHVNPPAWSDMSLCLCDMSLSESPYTLRVACDHKDALVDKKLHITEDRQIGFFVTFDTLAQGDTTVAVHGDSSSTPLFIVSGKGSNLAANGSKVDIKITEKQAEISVESSEEVSENTSGEVSTDASTELSIPDATSAPADSSESVTETTVIVDNNSDGSVAEGTSSEISKAETSENGTTTDGEKDGGYLLYIIIGVVALVGIATAVALWFNKRSDKKTEQELDKDDDIDE